MAASIQSPTDPMATTAPTPLPDPSALREKCAELAESPDILSRLVTDLGKVGLHGEHRAAKLIYLALTSRIFDKPISLAIKGPSSGGKSFTVGSVLKFLPESAAYVLTGMSNKALIYSEESLVNRILVIYEAKGIEGDFQDYGIRSLLSEGCIKYVTVETHGGLKSRVVYRPGPTGLITTTTRPQPPPRKRNSHFVDRD